MVRRTFDKKQRYIDDTLHPIVYSHSEHIKLHVSFFSGRQCPPHRDRFVTDSLAQEGIENLQWSSMSPDMKPSGTVGIVLNVTTKRNDTVTFDDLARDVIVVFQRAQLQKIKILIITLTIRGENSLKV